MTPSNLILETVTPGIRIITVSRPEALNALDTQTLLELKEVLQEESQSQESRVILLTGAGDKAFIVGADLKEMMRKNTSEAVQFSQLGHEVAKILNLIPKPVIAVVNGYALGGGTEMAIACDFILASDKAEFGQPEVGLGIIPGFGGTFRLAKFVGLPRAKELIFSGRKIKADEAKAIGLVNHVFPHATLMNQAIEIAKTISYQSLSAVSRTKLLLNEFSESIGISLKLDAEVQAFGRVFGSDDQIEGLAAFVARRKPNFQGVSRP